MHLLVRVTAGIFVIILSIGLASHQLPEFHNLNVLEQVYISNNAIPFTQYINFDKTIVGILILGFGCPLIITQCIIHIQVKSLHSKPFLSYLRFWLSVLLQFP